MTAKINEDCKTVFPKVMSFPVRKVNDKSSAENVENWDSLTHATCISFRKKFKIKISAEEGIDAFNNFKQLVFVQKK